MSMQWIMEAGEVYVSDRTENNVGRVMFLLSSLVIGGSERKIVRIANSMAASGQTVTIAYLNGPTTLLGEIDENVSVVCLERKGKFGVGAIRRLVSLIKSSEIDQICCINTYPLLYGFFARLLVSSRGFRLLATTNETKFVRRSDEIKMLIYAPLFRRARIVVFGSAYQQELWINRYKLSPSRCTYIYNGVDTDFFNCSTSNDLSETLRTKLRIPKNGLIVGSIGQFRKEKQYQVVIRACEELRKFCDMDVHCILVGGGFEEQSLREFVDERGCSSYVHLVDAQEDVRPYLEAMDIFVLSSISETFSNAALEAMAMKLPVVLPRVGGCPEMVKEGETGYIYEPGDIAGFVDCLYRLASDKDLRNRMGNAARSRVEVDFAVRSMVAAYTNLFRQEVH